MHILVGCRLNNKPKNIFWKYLEITWNGKNDIKLKRNLSKVNKPLTEINMFPFQKSDFLYSNW